MARLKKSETEAIEETETASGSQAPAPFLVESAFLHSAILVPGVPSEVNLNQVKIPGIVMEIKPYGLHCLARGKQFVVPHANIKSMVLK